MFEDPVTIRELGSYEHFKSMTVKGDIDIGICCLESTIHLPHPSINDLVDLFNLRFTQYKDADEKKFKIPPNMNYSTFLFLRKFRGTKGLLTSLDTSFTLGGRSGLNDREDIMAERQEMYGVNVYPTKRMKAFSLLHFEKLKDKLNKMLLATCLITMLAEIADKTYDKGYLDTAVMLFSVIILSGVSAISEQRWIKNHKKTGKDLSDFQVSVFRGDKVLTSIPAKDVVVGDIIKVEKGMVIPADCILIQAGHPKQEVKNDELRFKSMWSSSETMLVNEKDLTGEENYKVKLPNDFEVVQDYQDAFENCADHFTASNVLYAQTCVVSGQGVAVVCAVGPHTQYGIQLQSKFSMSRLDIDDLKISVYLDGYMSFYSHASYYFLMSFLMFVWCRKFLQSYGYILNEQQEESKTQFVLNSMVIVICLLIAVIPEALFLTIYKCISEFASLRIFLDKKLVFKDISTFEKLASIETVVFEKEGSLTNVENMEIRTCLVFDIDVINEQSLYSAKFTSREDNDLRGTSFFEQQTMARIVVDCMFYSCTAWIEKTTD